MSTLIKPTVIHPDQSYTFSDYFKLNPPVDELIAYFGYHHQLQRYLLPQAAIDESFFTPLQQELNEILLYVDLTSEIARREVLIAPVLTTVARYLKIKIRIEYFLEVNHQLRGTLDYLLQNEDTFLVVEAKDENLQRGFTQLAAELIALDQWHSSPADRLYGAVSIGNIWQFGILDRETKTVTQDVNLFRVPMDLLSLVQTLVAILTGSDQ